MNWFVSLNNNSISLFQSCCLPKKKELIIKENDFVDDEINNTKLNSDADGSKFFLIIIKLFYLSYLFLQN